MPELRKDYLLDRYVIIATERSQRPTDSIPKRDKPSAKTKCPFCPENEKMLLGVKEEIKGSDGNWLVRAVPNKYAAVSLEGEPKIQTHNKFFTFASAYGMHEVIIDTPDHNTEFEDLPQEHIEKVLEMYIRRIKALDGQPNIKYVALFKNRGVIAGASISHAHSQIIAYNALPTKVEEELKAFYDYFIKNEACPFCEIINIEKGSYRRCFEDEHFVAFTPYASRFAFEIWIFPKRHIGNIIQLDEAEIKSLACMLMKVLNRLDNLDYPPYNMQVHNAETGEAFHFHIEITPRLATWAGFEIATETVINPTSPEEAAKFYRGETQ